MKELIAETIKFVVSNYLLTLFVVGLIVAIAAMARSARPVTTALAIEKLLAWHVFFVIGAGYFVNFIFHGFFGAMAAAFIGWADSPFQFEVATASLGFSLVGFIAAFRSFDLRLAAILGPSIFLLGAAAGHIYQMITAHNFARQCRGDLLHGPVPAAVRVCFAVAGEAESGGGGVGRLNCQISGGRKSALDALY